MNFNCSVNFINLFEVDLYQLAKNHWAVVNTSI